MSVPVHQWTEKMKREVKEPVMTPDRSLMISHVLEGAKPRSDWKTGLEFELIGYKCQDLQRLDPQTIDTLLRHYSPEPILEGGVMAGARGACGSLTVEPGGQIEFSGLPRKKLAATEADLSEFVGWLKEQAGERGLAFLGVGFDPLRTLEEQKWFEKRRYSLMRPYLEKRGNRGLDMMTRTASIQVNIDFSSAEDVARKYVIGNRLAPIVAAIFANSPFREGRLSGAKSERALVWLETDIDRCGVAASSVSDDLTLDDWLNHILSTPMFFVRRGDTYQEMTHLTFGEFVTRPGGGVQPASGDFGDHLTTIFTEARIKRWIELRSADAGGIAESMAVQALWKGLMYDPATLDEAFRLMPRLTSAEYSELQLRIAYDGLNAEACGIRVLNLARSLVELALDGLSTIGDEEEKYLAEVAERVLRDGVAPADILIRNFEGSWHGKVSPLIDYLRVA